MALDVWMLWLSQKDVIVQELLEEVIAAACTSPAYKDHCKATDPCVEHLGYLHCTYFGSNLVVPFQYNNSAVRRGWFQSGPGKAAHLHQNWNSSELHSHIKFVH